MAKPYPSYFVIDGRPVKVVDVGEVRAMDLQTGAMVPDASYRELLATAAAVTKEAYKERLDARRQPILERYATAALVWERTGDNDMPYRVAVDGHDLAIRAGDFPDEALYILLVDGQEVYEIDDWPSAWTRPAGS